MIEPIPALESLARTCRSCGAPLERLFVDLGMAPPCEDFLTRARLHMPETFYPLDVRICDSCLLVQMPGYISASEAFSEYFYYSSFSDSWVEHARLFVLRQANDLGLDRDSLVLEVASNDGYLLQHAKGLGLRVLGIEPAGAIAAVAIGRGVPTINAFLTAESARDVAALHGRADLLIANNVFAHVPALNDFTSGLRTLLAPEGLLTIEVAYLVRLIDGNQFDTIYHEHFMYYTLISAERVLARNDLRIIDVEELATHGGSLRLHVVHASDPRRPTDRVNQLRERELEAGYGRREGYAGFGPKAEATKRGLLKFLIGAKENGASIVGYGAPGKGNTLLNYCGIRNDLVDYLVDRNPNKHGRYTPGTHIAIYPPEQMAETKPDYVLVLAWNLRQEILDQHRYIREWGGRFVLPIPQVEVLR